MKKDSGFQRKKWNAQPEGGGTDAPAAPIEDSDEFAQTRIWNPSPKVLPQQPMMWLIVAQPIEQRGMILAVQPGAIIGRHGDIRWGDLHMSRKHARFLLANDPSQAQREVYAVVPESDRNGTFVNGERIQHVTLLRENDVLEMGDTSFVVKILEAGSRQRADTEDT